MAKAHQGLNMRINENLFVAVHPEIKMLIGEAADAENIPMSEWVNRTLADLFGRPDLREVPKRRRGRPRKIINLKQRS